MTHNEPGPRPDGTPRQDVYGKPPGAGDWKRVSRLALLGLLVVFTILFFAFNLDNVEVSLVVTTVSIPLVVVLIGTFLLGAFFMYLLTFLRRRSARKTKA